MEIVKVVIETPRTSNAKYDFNPETGYFELKKIMPVGMVFPFDFGFIPGTLGQDGDPLDVIVFAEIETFVGCALDCKIIGAIQANQKERNGEKMRNDRYLAVPIVSMQYKNVSSIADLPANLLNELEDFFKQYNQLAGKVFMPFKRVNAKKAFTSLKNQSNNKASLTQLIQLFLPCYNNEGKPFAQSDFEEVSQTLTEKFNGLSTYLQAPVKGLWKDDQAVVKDDLLVFEVMAATVDIPFWENYKLQLKKKFKQQEIVVRSLAISLIK